MPMLMLLATPVPAQTDCTADAMLVFDGSGSMAEMGFNDISEPRIFDARRAMGRAMPEVSSSRRVGLVIYGPGSADDCSGIDLRFPPRPEAAGAIIAQIDGLQPAGETALTEAVALAAETLDFRRRPGVIVLVTDGKETCGGTPCALAAELAAEAADLTVHVVGFKVRGDRFSWEADSDYQQAYTVADCLADRTGGLYVATESVDELIEALRRTMGCPLLF